MLIKTFLRIYIASFVLIALVNLNFKFKSLFFARETSWEILSRS
ncbi:hypothetical protein AB751O23_AR_00080 [Chlamydiales bacterium SCGC AB-751-O23]|nr:hypothetical protein AB751O23_AR_00080 [Chlamydiales bacterium SCGC AB-751-O23]